MSQAQPQEKEVLMSSDYKIANGVRETLELKKGKVEMLPLHIAKKVVDRERGTYYLAQVDSNPEQKPVPTPPPSDDDADELPLAAKDEQSITANDVGDLSEILGVSPAVIDKANTDKGNAKGKGKKGVKK